MVKRRADAVPVPDPTIPDVSVEVDGERFRLCFDFRALAVAKARLRELGIEFNVLRSIDFMNIDVDTLPALFFAAAQRYQPKLTWQQAEKLVNMRTAIGIFGGLSSAYTASMLKPDKNPRKATSKS